MIFRKHWSLLFVIFLLLVLNNSIILPSGVVEGYPSKIESLDTVMDLHVSQQDLANDYHGQAFDPKYNSSFFPQTREIIGYRGSLPLRDAYKFNQSLFEISTNTSLSLIDREPLNRSYMPIDVEIDITELTTSNANLTLFVNWVAYVSTEYSLIRYDVNEPILNMKLLEGESYNTTLYYPMSAQYWTYNEVVETNAILFNSIGIYFTMNLNETWNYDAQVSIKLHSFHDPSFYSFILNRYLESVNSETANYQSSKNKFDNGFTFETIMLTILVCEYVKLKKNSARNFS